MNNKVRENLDNLNLETLNSDYSTTRFCYKLLDDSFLDDNGKVREDVKFKIDIPEFGIVDSKIPAKKDEKFDTLLFLPEGEGRKAEGGLRTKGYFKFSYKKLTKDGNNYREDKNGEWYIVDFYGNPVKKTDLPESVLPELKKENITYVPLVTVITVVLNGEKYLEETIRSVIKQTYYNVEYIIIDGGSTDGTLDIIKKYEDYIDYWVSEKDKGIYDAMNKGIRLSLGDYVGILNSDDCYLKDAIELSIDNILKEKADYSIANVKFYDGDVIRPIIPLYCKVYQEMPYPHVSAVISKRVYKEIGLFNEKFKIAGDHDMAVRIILKGYKYCYLDKTTAFLNKGGISNSLNSNIESYKVAIKNGKNAVLASFTFLKQVLIIFLVKCLPKKIVCYLQKLKKSRFAKHEL